MELTPDQLAKVQKMKWIENSDSDSNQPEMEVCNYVLDCVEAVALYVVENINFLDLQQDVYQVNVPIETHPLLAARYDSKWSEYSRSRVFDMVRAVFIQKIDDLGYLAMIENMVRKIFPKDDAQISVSHIDIYDEPEVDVTVTERELNLVTGEDKAVSTTTTSYSGNTVTVEVKIEILDSPQGILVEKLYNENDNNAS